STFCEGTIGPATVEMIAASTAGLTLSVTVSSSHGSVTVWISPPRSVPEFAAAVVCRRTTARWIGPGARFDTTKRRYGRWSGELLRRKTVAVPKFVATFAGVLSLYTSATAGKLTDDAFTVSVMLALATMPALSVAEAVMRWLPGESVDALKCAPEPMSPS